MATNHAIVRGRQDSSSTERGQRVRDGIRPVAMGEQVEAASACTTSLPRDERRRYRHDPDAANGPGGDEEVEVGGRGQVSGNGSDPLQPTRVPQARAKAAKTATPAQTGTG